MAKLFPSTMCHSGAHKPDKLILSFIASNCSDAGTGDLGVLHIATYSQSLAISININSSAGLASNSRFMLTSHRENIAKQTLAAVSIFMGSRQYTKGRIKVLTSTQVGPIS